MEQKYTDDTFLARWLNNDLAEEEKVAFEKTIEFKEYSKIIDKTDLFQAPEFDSKRVFAGIQQKIKTETKVKKLVPNWVYSIAASVALLFGVFYFINLNETFSTSYGEQLAIVLPDGSQVELNAKSELSFDKDDWENGQRTLMLSGEGFFKVKKGSKFTVYTESGSISVLGTQFNVKRTENYFSVKCFEGKVSVKNNNQETILSPGNGIQKIKGKPSTKIKFDAVSPSWITGESTFESTPLRVVIQELENQYNMVIESDNVDVNQLFSGSFTNKNRAVALQTVFIPLQIEYSMGTSGNLILSEK